MSQHITEDCSEHLVQICSELERIRQTAAQADDLDTIDDCGRVSLLLRMVRLQLAIQQQLLQEAQTERDAFRTLWEQAESRADGLQQQLTIKQTIIEELAAQLEQLAKRDQDRKRLIEIQDRLIELQDQLLTKGDD